MSFVVRTRMDSERFESARGEGDVQLLANLIYEESIITRDVRSSLSLFSLVLWGGETLYFFSLSFSLFFRLKLVRAKRSVCFARDKWLSGFTLFYSGFWGRHSTRLIRVVCRPAF